MVPSDCGILLHRIFSNIKVVDIITIKEIKPPKIQEMVLSKTLQCEVLTCW